MEKSEGSSKSDSKETRKSEEVIIKNRGSRESRKSRRSSSKITESLSLSNESDVVERAVVISSYVSNSPLELSLNVGVVVVVLKKTPVNENFVYCSYKNNHGLFPLHYLEYLINSFPTKVKKKKLFKLIFFLYFFYIF